MYINCSCCGHPRCWYWSCRLFLCVVCTGTLLLPCFLSYRPNVRCHISVQHSIRWGRFHRRSWRRIRLHMNCYSDGWFTLQVHSGRSERRWRWTVSIPEKKYRCTWQNEYIAQSECWKKFARQILIFHGMKKLAVYKGVRIISKWILAADQWRWSWTSTLRSDHWVIVLFFPKSYPCQSAKV